MTWQLLHGDCRKLMAAMPEASVDAIVCDPPYDLTANKKGGSGPASVDLNTPAGRARIGAGFMGMSWDATGVAFDAETWRIAARVLKPGGWLLAFGGSRTYHRLACAIEDAGFEIRDQIMWIYGSGFPKGGNRDGKGTCLKPAHEPIVMARKPCVGSAKANLAAFGTGALNIDACRVSTTQEERDWQRATARPNAQTAGFAGMTKPPGFNPSNLGRWPANVIHDGSDEVVALFPQASGRLADAKLTGVRKTGRVYGEMGYPRRGERSADSENAGAVGFAMRPGARRLDTGSAARFFKSCEWKDEEWHLHANNAPPANYAASRFASCAMSTAVGAVATETWGFKSAASPVILVSTASCGSCTQAPSRASAAARTGSIVITPTMAAHFKSSGFASRVIAGSISSGNEVKAAAVSGQASATRFLYCPKASKADRDEGLDQFAPQAFVQFQTGNGESGEASSLSAGRDTQYRNIHPTVKPEALMRYLVRLVTPEGGTVLDPFAGSGSTGKAAILEGYSFVGCELTAEYLPIAEARLSAAANRRAADLIALAPPPQHDLFRMEAA